MGLLPKGAETQENRYGKDEIVFMTQQSVSIIRLGCVACGANLEITPSMERLACGHCGTQQIVERSGGAIHLKGIAETLSRVQMGTDKTAAELAIARLTNERQQLQVQRSQRQQHWNQLRLEKDSELQREIHSKQYWVNMATGTAGAVAAVPSVLMGQAFLYVAGNKGIPAFVFVIIILMGSLGTALAVRNLMLKSSSYNLSALREVRDWELQKFDAQAAADLARFDAHINELNAKIQKNYQIANG